MSDEQEWITNSIVNLIKGHTDLAAEVEKERINRHRDVEDVLKVMQQLEDRITSKMGALSPKPPAKSEDAIEDPCELCGTQRCYPEACDTLKRYEEQKDKPTAKSDEELVKKYEQIIYDVYWKDDCSMSTEKTAWMRPILRAMLAEAREGR